MELLINILHYFQEQEALLRSSLIPTAVFIHHFFISPLCGFMLHAYDLSMDLKREKKN